MIRLRDEWGWTPWAYVLALAGTVLAVVAVSMALWWWTTPRDSQGRPLTCARSHEETWYQTITTGKTTIIVPETADVCDAWASPSPGGR